MLWRRVRVPQAPSAGVVAAYGGSLPLWRLQAADVARCGADHTIAGEITAAQRDSRCPYTAFKEEDEDEPFLCPICSVEEG